MNIFVISDTHFNHENIKVFENRPDNFNELIIKNWNKRVGKDDLVIHLGDVIFSRASELLSIMNQLNGTKVLALGNHDKKSKQWYLESGFSFVCNNFTWGETLFSHKPITPIPQGISKNVHGHFHRGENRDLEYRMNKYFQQHRDKYILVQIEDELRPFTLEEVMDRKAELKILPIDNMPIV